MIASSKAVEGVVLMGETRSQRLGITAGGWGHIAGILQDSLYTDKLLAPIREYATNAMDAHVEAGCPGRPILVSLPNRFAPMFCVRDYGLGMTDDRIWNIFCNYGESTKRSSNEQVGMLGIGSKSAFAYGKSFTVVNFRDGIKSTFACHTGGCAAGDFVAMGSESTTEENGLEIQIPVKSEDIDGFVQRSAQFFAHWEILPIFQGNNIDITPIEKEFTGTNWYLPKGRERHGYKRPKIIMGNIAYDLPEFSKLKSKEFITADGLVLIENRASLIERFFNLGPVLQVNIGQIDIAANRESVQLTDRTLKALWSIIPTALSELMSKISAGFDGLTTDWEKRKLRATYSNYSSGFHAYEEFLPSKYKDLKSHYNIDRWGSSTSRAAWKEIKINVAAKGRRGLRKVRVSADGTDNISLDENVLTLIDTKNLSAADTRNRVAVLIERDANHFSRRYNRVIIVILGSPEALTLWDAWKLTCNFDLPLVEVNTLPVVKPSELYPKVKPIGNGSLSNTHDYNSKNGKRRLVFNLDRKAGDPSDWFVEGVIEKAPKNKIPFVTINRYLVEMGDARLSDPAVAARTIKEFCAMFEIQLPTQIVAVKEGYVADLDKNHFIDLRDWIFEQIADHAKFSEQFYKIKIAELHFTPSHYGTLNRCFYNSNGDLFPINTGMIVAMKDVSFSKENTFGRVISFFNECITLARVSVARRGISYSDSILSFGNMEMFFKKYLKMTDVRDGFLKSVETLMASAVKEYPLLPMINSGIFHYVIGKTETDEAVKSLKEYITKNDKK